MKKTTIETLTDAQIRKLRQEAMAAGDSYQYDLCNRALADSPVDQDGNAIAFAGWTKEEARQACVEAIQDAEARQS